MNHAEKIRDALVASMTQFESGDDGTNLGVGFHGWDRAIDYARRHGLDYFGSVFLATGDEDEPKAFGYGMWTWGYYVRMHAKFVINSDPSPDEMASALAGDFMSAILDPTNIFAIEETGNVKVVSSRYLSEPENIEEVTYLTIEFLVHVKQQLSRG